MAEHLGLDIVAHIVRLTNHSIKVSLLRRPSQLRPLRPLYISIERQAIMAASLWWRFSEIQSRQ